MEDKVLTIADIESLGYVRKESIETFHLFSEGPIVLKENDRKAYYVKVISPEVLKNWIMTNPKNPVFVEIVKEHTNKYNPTIVFRGVIDTKEDLEKILKMTGTK